MAGQDFAELVKSRLLSDVEDIVVDAHRTLYESEGLEWSRPIAYHWLRYENPDPVERLKDGVKDFGKGVRNSTPMLWRKLA